MNSGWKRIAFLLIAGAALTGAIAFRGPVSGYADDGTPVFLTKIPPGYRDWRLISVAHEEGNLHSFAAMLGNDIAIKAFRHGKLPYPDGSIIAALHYSHVASEENDKVFGDPQSFVPGAPTNVQFMVKDSKKYAATGGWGSVISIKMELRVPRRSPRLAFPATRKLLATSSPNMRSDAGEQPCVLLPERQLLSAN